jgi:putative transposase
MAIRRSAHAVYDTKYHLVWTPKYRKWVKREDIRRRVREIFSEIGGHHGFEIQETRVAPDHVHIFFGFSTEVFDSSRGWDVEEYIGE